MNQPTPVARVYLPHFDLTVPGQPLPKMRPRVVGGRAYTPARTEQAEATLRWEARRLRPKPTAQPCSVRLDFWRADARHVDIDNLAKLVLDALNGEVWADDHWIVDLQCSKRVDRASPRTRVRVWLRDPEAAA